MLPTPPRWYCKRDTDQPAEGTFDLEEIAALLGSRDISGETLTQREGESAWIP